MKTILKYILFGIGTGLIVLGLLVLMCKLVIQVYDYYGLGLTVLLCITFGLVLAFLIGWVGACITDYTSDIEEDIPYNNGFEDDLFDPGDE